MSFLATVNSFVSANQVLVMNGVIVALILLQVGLLVNAFMSEEPVEMADVDEDDHTLDVWEVYGHYGYTPWMF